MGSLAMVFQQGPCACGGERQENLLIRLFNIKGIWFSQATVLEILFYKAAKCILIGPFPAAVRVAHLL